MQQYIDIIYKKHTYLQTKLVEAVVDQELEGVDESLICVLSFDVREHHAITDLLHVILVSKLSLV